MTWNHYFIIIIIIMQMHSLCLLYQYNHLLISKTVWLIGITFIIWINLIWANMRLECQDQRFIDRHNLNKMGGWVGVEAVHGNVSVFWVPQLDNSGAGQAHQSRLNWDAKESRGGRAAVFLPQHKDNNVNTRITNRNAFCQRERTDGAISSLPAAPCNRNVG